jgi:uncharacterized protein YhjY with autotransporter beta-barrel domain
MACTFGTSVTAIFKGNSVRNISFGQSLRGFVCVASSLAVSGAVTGQNLTNLQGLTELQAPVAKAIQDVCTKFGQNIATYGTPDLNGTLQQRLYFSCRAMVQTANQIKGDGSPTTFSLGIAKADRLAIGVQDVAPVQMNAQKQIGTEASKSSLLTARLFDLRGGARGVVFGLNGVNNYPVTASASNESSAGATGGAASADSDLSARYGGFVNVSYNRGSVDQTVRQDAYDFDGFNLLAGVDYRVSDSLVVGGAISYNDTDSDFDRSLGKVKARTIGVAGYGTYFVNEWFLDGFVSYGSVDFDSTRNIFIPSTTAQPEINTSATAKPKGDQWSASLAVGRSWEAAPYTVTPSARLSYLWVRNKAFTEDEPKNGLGLAVDARTIQSVQSALGAKVSTTLNTSAGVFVPYLTGQWIHEFKNDNPSIVSKYFADPFGVSFAIPTESPDRDYAVVSLGSSATFPNNLSGFAQVSTVVGLRDISNYGIVLGLRKQF